MLVELAIICRHVVQQLSATGKVADQLFAIFFQFGFVLFQFGLQ